ncbi:NUDIX hydrolase [Nitrococcus mobilis]|uniref:Phosphatase NudJ n=1 Tax=Nitrococcus mobilis Nb-231 TaxID=314278 RepID=A4BTH4_9GAMM|nr:NUDIX hydrolase [Nitrococcus mobilis]EAR20930.1 hypothetical protein NB231_00055 [Nitrococcus mobilis Nb-231]
MTVWKPHVTVAAVVERANRFLMVEETAEGRRVLNQPAGHLEPGESLLEAMVRETREETGWEVEGLALVGIYRWPPHPNHSKTFLRVTFAARALSHNPHQALDKGILGTHWLTRDELTAAVEWLRSPLVLQSATDYLAGRRYPLELFRDLE